MNINFTPFQKQIGGNVNISLTVNKAVMILNIGVKYDIKINCGP